MRKVTGQQQSKRKRASAALSKHTRALGVREARRLVSGRAAAFTAPPQDLLQQGSPSHCQRMTSLAKLIDHVGRIYPHEDKYFLIPHVKKSKSPKTVQQIIVEKNDFLQPRFAF